MVKILRMSQENHEAQFPKFSGFIGQISISINRYAKAGIQIQVYNINNECEPF